jgi:hypothetical protein
LSPDREAAAPRRRRISITCDEELDIALARVRGRVPATSEAALVRAMALRGVAATVGEGSERRQLIEQLITRITAPDWPPMTPEELERSAWGIERKLPAELRAEAFEPETARGDRPN